MIKVLLCEASGRQVLPMVKAFHKLGCEVTTVQGRKTDLGAISRYVDKKYVVKNVDEDSETATKFYYDLIKKGTYDLVVPLSDFSAGIVAKFKKDIESQTKTKIATNEFNIFMNAFDKLSTMKICMENGIGCPFTLKDVNSIDDVPENISYPLIMKPRSSCGSIGLHIAENRDKLQKYIEHSNDENGGNLIQEFIPQTGRQYNAHFFIDGQGNVKTALLAEKCRWFPTDGGASTLCRTVHRDDIVDMCKKMLNIMGWQGYCDIDLIEDPRDGSIRVIEINARISANIKLCFVSGVNIAEQLLALYLGREVPDYKNYPDDIRLRCIHTDLLWFLKSNKRFNAEPSWFSMKNTYDQIFYITNPVPFIVFSFGSLFKYSKEMNKRKRTL